MGKSPAVLVLVTVLGLSAVTAWAPMRVTDVTFLTPESVPAASETPVRSDAYDTWGWLPQAFATHADATRTEPAKGTFRRTRTVAIRWGRWALNFLGVWFLLLSAIAARRLAGRLRKPADSPAT